MAPVPNPTRHWFISDNNADRASAATLALKAIPSRGLEVATAGSAWRRKNANRPLAFDIAIEKGNVLRLS